MVATATDTAPLLDGRFRTTFLAVIMIALTAMTIDGTLTWLAAEEATEVIDVIEQRVGEIDNRGLILSDAQRAEIAAASDGDRLDRDEIDTKTWLAVIATIAATALTLASEPGSSRRVLAIMVVIAAAAFFVPLYFYADAIDIVTTSHGG